MKKLTITAAALIALCSAVPAWAWKPTVHVFLADLALRDALDDGRITVDRVNFQTGQKLGTIGTYAVDPELLNALRRFPGHYRAGVVGPDAYPDILTGQQCIHVDVPDGAPGGTNSYLEYIWARSQLPSLTGDTRLKARAFAAGYLTHAAGDMYAHTFVNHYAGGDFVIGANGVRHFVLEGYVGKRCQPPTFDISVAGIEDWIYDTLIDARKGTFLAERLLIGAAKNRSIPFIYSKLRDKLVADVDFFHRNKDDIPTLVGQAIPTKYKEEWIKDIDRGLRELVNVSHALNRELLMTPDLNSTSLSNAKEIVRRYATLHLLSMSGAPDFVGLTLNAINEITEAIVNAVFPQFVKDFIKQIKEDVLNYILRNTVGMTLDEIKSFLSSPEQHFDRVMSQTNSSPNKTTLAAMNREMKVNDPGFTNPSLKFKVEEFPPAYNTMVLSKLIFLPQSEVNRLISQIPTGNGIVAPLPTVSTRAINERALAENQIMRDKLSAILLADAQKEQEAVTPPGKLQSLVGKFAINQFAVLNTGGTATLNASNIMLGFNKKIDGSNQWHVNPAKMVLVHAGKYDQIFMKQSGDTTPPGASPTTPPPAEDLFSNITVKINKLVQIGRDIEGKFLNGAGDYYTVVTINGGPPFIVDDIADTRVVNNPPWSFTKAALRARTVPIRIEIWDSDGNLRGDDDPIDVNPASGRVITLNYNPQTRTFTGSVSGRSGVPVTCRGTESDNAEITFTITGT